jgi:hypothetical protein
VIKAVTPMSVKEAICEKGLMGKYKERREPMAKNVVWTIVMIITGVLSLSLPCSSEDTVDTVNGDVESATITAFESMEIPAKDILRGFGSAIWYERDEKDPRKFKINPTTGKWIVKRREFYTSEKDYGRWLPIVGILYWRDFGWDLNYISHIRFYGVIVKDQPLARARQNERFPIADEFIAVMKRAEIIRDDRKKVTLIGHNNSKGEPQCVYIRKYPARTGW